jgi:DNA-binding transcriptional regulator YiaG
MPFILHYTEGYDVTTYGSALLRQRLDLTPKELATMLRVEHSTVWRWESGLTPVPHATMLLLALLCDYPQALEKIRKDPSQ